MKKSLTKRLCQMALSVGILLAGQMTYAQTLTLPYFCGFEDPVENAQWTLNAGNNGQYAANKWYVSGAEVFMGDSALNISNTQGQTATYTNSPCAVVAYRTIQLPAGTYDFSYTYYAGGESNNDALYVCVVSNNVNLVSNVHGNLPQGIPSSTTPYFRTGGWKVYKGTITSSGLPQKIALVWRNNGSNNCNPGGCIDNIQISSQSCGKPSNIFSAIIGNNVTLSWSGNASSYDFMYRRYGTRTMNTVTGLTSNTYTVQNLSEGVYDFMLRSNCSNDTSIWVVRQNLVLLDSTAHCINFRNLTGSGTVCTYGTYTNPKQNIGVVDSGPSQMSSRHTLHTTPGETDSLTGNGLATIPKGEVASVRLGNWNAGAEAETVTYTYTVPTDSNNLFVLNYAVVFEEPSHEEAPEFSIEITDINGQLLDSCLYAMIRCDGLLTDPTWHTFQSGYSEIWWKEWTKAGFDLSQYAGQTVKICLTTKDCSWAGHFGYAYFTLSCAEAGLKKNSDALTDTTVYTAPDCYTYRWINNSTRSVVSTDRSYAIYDYDTCSYTCICSSKINYACSFSYVVAGTPRMPESSFSYDITYSDCQSHINFTNNSQVYIVEDSTKRYLPQFSIESQHWSVQTDHQEREYYNMESDSLTLGQIDVPRDGDTISVTLTARFYGFENDSTIIIYVPQLPADVDTVRIDTTAQNGTQLRIAIPYAGDPARYAIDTTIVTSGTYILRATSSIGCDSIYVEAKVTFADVTDVEYITSAFDVYLAPNPIAVGDNVRVMADSEMSTVEIYTLAGKCVKRIDTCDKAVDVEGLNVAGVYVVRVVGKNGQITTRKLIVE